MNRGSVNIIRAHLWLRNRRSLTDPETSSQLLASESRSSTWPLSLTLRSESNSWVAAKSLVF